jgi:thiamine biosynthesis lipoprotein ApbE
MISCGSFLAYLLIFVFVLLVNPNASEVSAEVLKLKDKRIIMGTYVEVTIYGEDATTNEKALEAAFKAIEAVDKSMSDYKSDSEVSEINRAAEKNPVKVSDPLIEVLEASKKYYKWSRGAFDITVAPLMVSWGFKKHVKEVKTLPTQEEISKLLNLIGSDKVTLSEGNLVKLEEPGMAIDLGAIAKGYAVDKAVEALKAFNVVSALVNAGGDLFAFNSPPERPFWDIGLQNPKDKQSLLGTLKIKDMAVATSGNYEKYFMFEEKRYTHIMDPRTGYPVSGMASTTVIAKSAMEADALSTSVFVLGPEDGVKLMEDLKVDGILIKDDLKIYKTKGFDKYLAD